MWQFKPEHLTTVVVLRRHGIAVSSTGIEKSTPLTDAIGQLIWDEYPGYQHLVHEVDPKTKRSDTPFRIGVPELVKKKASLLTSQALQTDGNLSSQSDQKQELPLSESKPLTGEELPKRKPGRPRKVS